jgi:hypothetical protein
VAARVLPKLFIEQMRRNEVLDTEIEDLSGGDIGAAAAETKAIATGDPRYLRQVELDDAVRRLTAPGSNTAAPWKPGRPAIVICR